MNAIDEKEKTLGKKIKGAVYGGDGEDNFDASKKPKGIDVTAITKDIVFYSTAGCPTFTIPEYERDSGDNIVIDEKSKKPRKLYATDVDGNNRRLIEITHKFERVPHIDPHTGKTDAMKFTGRYILKADDPRRDDILAKIRTLSKNPFTGIISEGEFKTRENAAAYRLEQENVNLKSAVSDLEAKNQALQAKLTSLGAE